MTKGSHEWQERRESRKLLRVKAEVGKRKAEGCAMRMEGLRERTKQFAMRVVRLYTSLPESTLAQTLGKQVLRSGTSVAANFREASRARSSAEFISKLGIVEQELDETALWLELLEESGVFPKEKLVSLRGEADELIRIVVVSLRRSKSKKSAAVTAAKRTE